MSDRKKVLDKVMDEFNQFEGVAANVKYQLPDVTRRVLTNLLTLTSPKAFARLQQIHDALPATLSPVTLDALATTSWLLNMMPKGFKESMFGDSEVASGHKVLWKNALRMTGPGQELLMERVALLCDSAVKRQKPGSTASRCVLDLEKWEEEALYSRWCAHGLQQLEGLMKAAPDSIDPSLQDDVRRRSIEGAYKETFSGLYTLKEPFEYR